MKIHRFHEEDLRNASTPAQVAEVLQHVIKLEHATTQPYFTALFSIKKGTNAQVEQHIRWVAMEEMLHMCIVANMILALGEWPILDHPSLVPTYPGPLPMGAGDELIISCEKYSPEQAQNVFMGIEHPQDPLELDDDALPEVQAHSTIGRLYHLLARKLPELGSLPGNPAMQVDTLDPYTMDELFAIKTMDDALRAIEIIVEQGEGTTSSPVSPSGKMAHYYRFQELAVGRRIVADDSAEEGYSFTGEVIEFDPESIYNLWPNTKLADIPEDTDAYELAHSFAACYTKVMKLLHVAFNGYPETICDPIAAMKDLQKIGYEMAATPFPGRDGYTLGPTWEFLTDTE